jgi:hypothetical protein
MSQEMGWIRGQQKFYTADGLAAEVRAAFEEMCQRVFGWSDFTVSSDGMAYANPLVQRAWEQHLEEHHPEVSPK